MFLPQLALAHSPIKGIGYFLNGMLHPLLVPAQIIVIIALGLFFGQHKPAENKLSMLIFLMATIVGLIYTLFFIAPDVFILLLVIATFIGLLLISGFTIPPILFVLLAVVVGVLVGLDSSQEGLGNKETIVSLFGSGVGIYFLMLYSMALSETLSNKHWQIIAVRVIASWLSASAMMVLALSFSH